jgi:hypothetical protein
VSIAAPRYKVILGAWREKSMNYGTALFREIIGGSVDELRAKITYLCPTKISQTHTQKPALQKFPRYSDHYKISLPDNVKNDKKRLVIV